MRCYVTTSTGLRESLELDGPPRWRRALQCGYLDASIPVRSVPESLKGRLRRATVELHGTTGCVYHGRILEYKGGVLSCVGKWDDLHDSRRGVVFRSANSGWMSKNYWVNTQVQSTMTIDNSGIALPPNVLEDGVWTQNYGWAHFLLPEPVPAVRIWFQYEISSSPLDGGLMIEKHSGFAAPWRNLGTYEDSIGPSTHGTAGSYGRTITGEDLTSISLQFALGKTILTNLFVYGSPALADANALSAVVAEICAIAGETNFECTADDPLGDLVDDLAFGPKTSAGDMFEELIKYGEFRCYYTNRAIAGVDRPFLLFEQMPSTPITTLRHDGSSVIVDVADESAKGLASVVRAHYTDTEGRSRFVEATDTTPGHLLVDTDQAVVTDIDVDTTSANTAMAAAQALVSRVGADRASGTVILKGSPNGTPASAYEPGRYAFVTPSGAYFEADASDIAYDGDVATMTLDNTVSIENLLARISARSGSQRDRSW